ncbi:hypothetical protein AYO21_10698 [Fonsecaea monophora]|uniref:Uncharacterized protein n=1 Tax=Fonsecaea monophora TaxID=254056 RepID=A0A177EUM5_9EURO|nr:hypothetical protein AYO21_10698 [Fonsecaea monophora]KAH0835273.1 hypothetical protein FOPE_03982 [Fonsecaea pedrosoi]OAG35131.1 hypothetical protein AYO21_10698 [Fonsecaea monophora]
MLVKGSKWVFFLTGTLSFLIVFVVLWKGLGGAEEFDLFHLSDHSASSHARTKLIGIAGADGTRRKKSHRLVTSVSTPEQKYFAIDFGGHETCNPNIIPHPQLADTWIVVAQRLQSPSQDPFVFNEIACNAVFDNATLRCVDQPTALPIQATSGPHCKGDLAHLAFNLGPHDARVFYGPSAPFTVYGSNSLYTCFGQWLRDFRPLVSSWGATPVAAAFADPVDLQKPAEYHPIEKNWFVFWDLAGQIYVHHDLYPKRTFARLLPDGGVGPNLSPAAEATDAACIAKHMPRIGETLESIHQATNSLSVTLCARGTCTPDARNTFILSVFQHKSFHAYHSVYEPYVILFAPAPPFQIVAISKKPFWVNGRGLPGEKRPDYLPIPPTAPWNQTEMLYVTSLAWKAGNQTYHGYLDDVVFVAFGVEDEQSAGIDVVVGDLLLDLAFC